MKIHVLSDLHLERGSYRLPSDLDFDVLVAAGDVSEDLEQAVGFLTAVGKPVVYVLGNHEYWSESQEDAGDRLARLRALAAGSAVHVLENESVEISGVRFLGCSLWTDFGSACLPDRDLILGAVRHMNDFRHIGAGQLTEQNREWLEARFKDLGLGPLPTNGRLHPLLAWRDHCRSREWLLGELRRPYAGRTVVVTHHAPSWRCVVRTGFTEEWALDPGTWHSAGDSTPAMPVVRLAAYASNDITDQLGDVTVDLWICGHIHAAFDLAIAPGVRCIGNPRGYPTSPLTAEQVKSMALWYSSKNAERLVERMRSEAATDPNLGDALGFRPDLVIDLETQTLLDAYRSQLSALADEMEPLLEQAQEFHRRIPDGDPLISEAVRKLAHARCGQMGDALDRTFSVIQGDMGIEDFAEACAALGLPLLERTQDAFEREDGDGILARQLEGARRTLDMLRRLTAQPGRP